MRSFILALVVALCMAPAVLTAATITTIDFSTLLTFDACPCDPRISFSGDEYISEGVVFDEASDTMLWVQGDDAIGPGEPWAASPTNEFISGHFTAEKDLTSLSVRLAPTAQGTYEYTLNIFDKFDDLISTTSLIVTQDLGDLSNTGFGYFSLNMTGLFINVASFDVRGSFIRSSHNNPYTVFGMSSMSFTSSCYNNDGVPIICTSGPTVVPIPPSLLLFGAALLGLGVFSRHKRKT
ncbi:MAG: hypothetical protein JKY12_06395 [Sneathiella sp.]|nr:hypothetical protein [Sneathiella sp.]